MPEGTCVGSVYLDFVVRNTVAQQIRDITSQAAAQAQKGFEAAGKASGDAMQRAFSGGYNKTLEKARVKVRELESQFDSLGSKMDGMRQNAKGMFKGLKDPGRAADQFLGNDKAFNALTAQQEAVSQKLLQAQEVLRIETEAASAKAAQAQQRAQEKMAAAAERSKARQEAAEAKVAAAEERARQRAVAAAERAEAKKTAAAERAAAAEKRAQAQAARESEKQWQKATKGIRGLFKTVGSTMKATFLTAGLYAFFRAMKSLMSGAAGQSKEFSAALEGVKSNLRTAFAPILDAVLPALTALMQGLANATRAVAAFIASIFGQTFAQAEAAGKKLQSVSSAAGGAAKKANATLGIDELNVVDPDGSGGGGGASAAIADTGEEMTGLMNPLEAFWARFKELMAPSIAAWSAAWDQIQSKAVEVWPRVQAAAQNLWDAGLKPLGSYLLTDFAPSVANAFSEAFAPITGDVISTYLQLRADDFVFWCGLITDAIQSVLLPALELVKHIWTGLMDGIKTTWEQYGKPICDGVVEAFNWILAVLQNLWDIVVKPFLQYCIEKGTELWDQTLKPLWDNFLGLVADISSCVLTFWNNVLMPLLNWIVQVFGPYWEKIYEGVVNVVKYAVQRIGDSINIAITLFRGLLQFFTAVFRGDWDGAWEAVQNTVVKVWDGIKNAIRNTVNGIIDIVNGMIAGICAGINAILRAVSSVAGKLGFDISPQVTPPQIPHLAQGGYVAANTPQLALIGDNKREGEIVAPESKIAEAVAAGMAGGLNGAELLALLGQMLEILRALLEKDESITIGDDTIYRSYERGKQARGGRVVGNPALL